METLLRRWVMGPSENKSDRGERDRSEGTKERVALRRVRGVARGARARSRSRHSAGRASRRREDGRRRRRVRAVQAHRIPLQRTHKLTPHTPTFPQKESEKSTHSKAIQRLRRALIDINAPNAALRTRRVLIEPYRGGVVRDGHLERRDRGAVVRGARAGVEAVERGVVVVLGDAWRGEYRLDHVVCAVRDCVIERLDVCVLRDVRYAVRKVA